MANVLYITANPYDESKSYSMSVGKAFIDTYKNLHPQDVIVHLDLYKESIPYLDTDVFNGWEKLRSGASFTDLSSVERSKVGRLAEIGGQFFLADKYVFVTPLWNFTIPAVMKTYIDAVTVSGKTFKYSVDGPVGLLKGKKAMHIQARGDIYSNGPDAEMEMGDRYLELMMNFYGITSFETVFMEGHMRYPEKAQELKEKAMAEAKEAAKRF